MIEKNRKVFKNLELNFKLLSNSQYQLNNTDSVIFLDKQNIKPFDLVFLDPPFNQNLIPMTLELLSQKNYLHYESQIYIESEYEITPTLLENHLEYDIAPELICSSKNLVKFIRGDKGIPINSGWRSRISKLKSYLES